MPTTSEIQYHNCYACDKKISEYYLEKFFAGVQVMCEQCYNLRKDYMIVQKQLQEVANGQ